MAAVLRHWREASTLVIVAARRKSLADVRPKFVNSQNQPTTHNGDAQKLKSNNFDVLLLKRSGNSKFMPNSYVFPGGVADDVDFSAEWVTVFDSLGKDHRQKLFDFVQSGGPGAPMFSRQREERFSHVPSEIAFRICAIRETFEESGVLIACRTKKVECVKPSPWDGATWASYIDDEAVITEWRQRVNKDPREFLRMCQELDMVPDVWSLFEWSNWLTPKISKQRFDTAFYVCFLQDKPHVAEDEAETVHTQWGSPYDIVHEYYQGRVCLPPPQLYELARLTRFSLASELLQFAWHRRQHRVEQWDTVLVKLSDCDIFVLPGDSLFSKDVDHEVPAIPVVHEEALAELEQSHPNKNRFVHLPDKRQPSGALCMRVICNIILPGEHVSPADITNSKLLNSLTPRM